MCGIAGKITPGRAADRDTVEAMCAALRHRGPDSSGVYVRDQVALGMTRLAVIDLVAGDQPMHSEDGAVTLVLNGEIYNHQDLRSELRARGHRFASRSDAEVVVHLWEEEGEACVERLHGMFAFAIWDHRRQELFLARDRLGKKPLVYHRARGGLAFASELRSLLEDPEAPREVEPVAIDAFLTHQYVPHERCAFRGLHKLAPATTLSWRPGETPRLRRYWRLEYEPKLALGAGEAREHVRELILDATRARLQSDVPLGAFLSGGVDSGAVVAAMAMNSSEPVRTFTATFAEPDFDEREHARRVAERYGTDHCELEVGAADASLLSRIASHFGEPFADPAALPTFQLAELTRRHVTVCLCGDGGDEAFAGYRRYWQIRATLAADRLPLGARRSLARALGVAAGNREGRRALPRAARLARRVALPPGRRFADLGRWFTEDDRNHAYGPLLRETLVTDPVAEVERAWLAGDGLGGVDRATATDIETYLPDDLLTKVDIASMAHSLEVRAPLLDHRLLEFAARLPEPLRLRGTSGKRLLRDAVSPWLPEGLAERPKQGFGVPIGDWLRGELRSLPEEVLLDPASRARGLFVDREVERMIEAHRAGHDRAQQLWAMINLELWFRTCVDRPPVHGHAEQPALL